MSATTATNTSLKPAIPKRTGQRGRHVARKRAVAFDESLQVDDTSKGQLQTSPSFSPAYLLAALEWAEDSENRNIDRPGSKPSRVPGRSGERKPLVPSSAHKTASNLKLRPGRRNDDVKKLSKIRPRPFEPSEPSTPRIDLLPEKLVFRSRQTPVSFLPPPSSVSPDAASKSVFFNNNKLPPSPISPSLPLQNRKQHHRYQQQRPGTSNEVGRPPWYNGPKKASFSADNVAQVANETDRIILARPPPPPGGKRSDGKPAVYQTMQPSAVPPPSMTKSSSPPRQPQGPVREAFAFFSRGRKKSHASDSPRSTLTKRSRALPISSTSTSAETQETQFDSTHSPQSPGINSIPDMARFPAEGENPTGKSVVVRCKGTTVTVLVTKETSAADLLVSCSRSLADLGRPINPDTSVVIEPCVRPGLERRLRQYELVWDVISAWDNDSSNFLIILSDTSDPDRELSLSSVPKSLDEPEGFVLPLYFLQRPGKWTQRFITLKENGQVFASKKQDFKPSDKNVARLCHLSDFDLYLPTEAEMRKQLRPPKRYCYAIRSQQKATLFIDSTHYCHFFCTEDPIVARQFRSAVQGWRSWYLVNKKLGLHEKKEVSSPVSLSKGDHGYRSRASTDQGSRGDYCSRGRSSVDQGPRGRPSVDQAPLIQSVPSSRDDVSPDASAGGVIPPVPPLPASLQGKKAEVFTATGLLGNGYDERRQQVLRQEASTRHRRGTVTTSPDDGPFIDGPSLLNNHAAATPTSDARPQTSGSGGSPASPSRRSDRAGWFPSAVQHSAEQQSTRPPVSLSRRPSTSSHGPSRSRSVRQRGEQRGEEQLPPLPTQKLPPQPLIDLTPTFVEPPQWNREGRGRGVRAPQGKPLVDLATGHVLPPSTAARFRDAAPPKNLLRRPDTAAPSATSGGSGGGGGGTLMDQYDLQKSTSQRGRPRAPTLGDGADPIQGGLLGDLARRNTVRSNASAGGGGSRPSVPSPAAAAAYMQSRGKTMRVGDAERDKLRGRLRSVEGRGRG
ncbi:hypothetical protein CHGG_07732 [Chaetomium globosum CBS 148.51]|uniref:PH domain-containing protein n=1 Tax=Chaetomium globosum (strain ATCC 6205 / CBS 148.51 / DSM 1962 / NBRC 6347 / NRRL 1970) TaxID=306901 RepID=Q2GWC2_CHAGB|nr:uncharacterized protein CHGG_07732 [Chaetomium globosum CBS 148.51]EAQ86479.1 hypothetical protein CHGG_07732 [Chaetomium globosum CBS 148.51]